MAIELIDNPDGDLQAAFDLIERKVKEGHKFNSAQKDLGILMSIDALADSDRPWFLEIAEMNNRPLWQTLWGQFRRCQEWGNANAPIFDPGWDESATGDYGMNDRPCEICGNVFKPEVRGQIYDTNACGAEAMRRAKGIDKILIPATTLDIPEDFEQPPGNFVSAPEDYVPRPSPRGITPKTGAQLFAMSKTAPISESVDLGVDDVREE